MRIVNRRIFFGGLAASAALPNAAHFAKAAARPLQVGFVYVGPIGDFGWSYQHDQARRTLEARLADKIQTRFVENVNEGPDAERVLRQLASSGSQLIFTTSFGFMNAALRVARQFPAVKFEQATGFKTAPNLSEYNARFYEARAVCGTLAGHLSKTGTIGYVGSFPIPEVVMGINAFTLAARQVNPAIKTRVIWVNSWFDPGREADAAKSLADQGADILCTHTDSPAVMQIAEQRKLYSFGQDSDMRKFGPTAQLTAIEDHWADYYVERTQAALDGHWTASNVWLGLNSGLVRLAPYGPGVTGRAGQAAETIKAAIIAGRHHPFTGPIKDQSGQIRLTAGDRIADGDLLRMDWYVEGVQT